MFPPETQHLNSSTHRRHVLTINLEEYFQVDSFRPYVDSEHWGRYESRAVDQTERVLRLLADHRARATFFVSGWLAERVPELVRSVVRHGHEVASHGYSPRHMRQYDAFALADDLARSREVIEHAAGQQVLGFRIGQGWFGPADTWAYDVLARLGFQYDSSVAPLFGRFRREPWRRFAHKMPTEHGDVYELPVSTVRVAGFDLPIGGGNWVRQLPAGFVRRATARWCERYTAPLVMYFHTWELDPEQPRFAPPSLLTRLRHYRNLDAMPGRVAEYLRQYSFTTAADYLGHVPLAFEPDSQAETVFRSKRPTEPGPATSTQPVTIVIPLYNEEPVVPYLANTLHDVRSTFRRAGYLPTFLLVDDGSRDRTAEVAGTVFAHVEDVRLISHPVNRGVAAAIQTGIRAAETELIGSLDADCTYDPRELLAMLPLLTPDVAMVAASPYHPLGHVRNVPGWRLWLSQGASWLYRRLFRNKLFTYTSCCRVYRRSRVKDISLTHGNFLGVVELLGRLDLAGERVLEHPATLRVRMLGRSKMKTLRTIAGHLKMMAKFLSLRLTGGQPAHDPEDRDRALRLLAETAGTPCHVGLMDPPARPKAVLGSK